MEGIGPSTSALRKLRSTVELHRQVIGYHTNYLRACKERAAGGFISTSVLIGFYNISMLSWRYDKPCGFAAIM